MICHCFNGEEYRLFALPPRFTECKLAKQIAESVKISPLITIYEAAEATRSLRKLITDKELRYYGRASLIYTFFVVDAIYMYH